MQNLSAKSEIAVGRFARPATRTCRGRSCEAKSPSSGRRCTSSSGLGARDKVACAMQAPAKCCKAQHDVVSNRPLQPEVKCDISPTPSAERPPLDEISKLEPLLSLLVHRG